MLAHGRWFSPGTLASSTTKNGHHDIAEILLKVALKHQKSSIIIIKNFEYYKNNSQFHSVNTTFRSAGRRSTRSTRTSLSSAPLSRQVTSMSHIDLSPVKVHCPIAIQQQLLGLERPSCRCSRHFIPQLTDIEFEEFVQIEASESQLIVISVISSL